MKRIRTWLFSVSLALVALGSPAAAYAQDTAFPVTHPFRIADSGSAETRRSEPAPGAQLPQTFAIAVGGLYTHRTNETSGWAPNLQVDYAPTSRLELHFMAPYAFDRLAGGRTHFGIGDVEIGFRYRIIDENLQGWEPAVAVYPLIDFPSGNARKNLGTGSTHAFLPLWLAKSFGDWTPYGGGGYWINPGPNNKDWIFVAAGVQRRISDALTVGGEIFHATSSKTGIKGQTGFDVNGRYNFTDNHHMLFSLGRGLQNAKETNQVTAYVAYLLTF
jgi:hypothetical protein